MMYPDSHGYLNDCLISGAFSRKIKRQVRSQNQDLEVNLAKKASRSGQTSIWGGVKESPVTADNGGSDGISNQKILSLMSQ